MKKHAISLFVATIAVIATDVMASQYGSRIIDVVVASSNCTPPPNNGTNGGQ